MKRMFCVLAFFLCCVSALSVEASQNVVSLHAAYTLRTPASEGYPDSDGELTNGRYGTPVANGDVSYYYRNDAFVGFKNSDATDGVIIIELDLGEHYTDLTVFEIGALTETDVGIRAPQKVAFLICDTPDGTYTPVGDVTHDASDVQKAHVLSVSPDEPLAGRYVRCEITPAADAAWTFVDELTVLQGKSNIAEPSVDSSQDSTPSQSFSVTESENPSTSTPATGDTGAWRYVLIGAASAFGTVALLGRRRRRV